MNLNDGIAELIKARARLKNEVFSDWADNDITEAVMAQYLIALALLEVRDAFRELKEL